MKLQSILMPATTEFDHPEKGDALYGRAPLSPACPLHACGQHLPVFAPAISLQAMGYGFLETCRHSRLLSDWGTRLYGVLVRCCASHGAHIVAGEACKREASEPAPGTPLTASRASLCLGECRPPQGWILCTPFLCVVSLTFDARRLSGRGMSEVGVSMVQENPAAKCGMQ